MTPETRRFATQADKKYWKGFHEWFRVVKPNRVISISGGVGGGTLYPPKLENVLPVGRK
jgi:hypothetical protein